MSGPYVEQTAEPGEAAKGVELVTEEIEDRFWEAAAPGPLAAGDGIGSGEVRRGLIAVAAALVAAAEERGAAKERERIAAELLAVDPVEWALAGQHAGVEAAKIVRGSS